MAQPATSPKIEELRFRLKTDPKSRLFFPLAEELRKAGALDDAEQVLRTGLSAHPTYLSAWVSLGRVLRDQKKDGDAIEPLTKALQLDPGNVVAARLLADAYYALGEKVEAIKKYKLVHALLPADQDVVAAIQHLERDIGPAPPAAPAPVIEAAAAPVIDPAPQPVVDPAPEPVVDQTPEPVADAPAPFVETAPEPIADAAPEPPQTPPEPELAAPLSEPDLAASPEPELRTQTVEEPFSLAEEPSTFAAAEEAIDREQRVEIAAADDEPMSRAHDASPFEEPVDSYTSASLALEAPAGFHVERAPLAADVPTPVTEEFLPTVESAPYTPEPTISADEADIFAPAGEENPFASEEEVFAAEPPPAAAQEEDLTNTLTMAELYARQGALAEARQIYDNILARDPENHEVRARLEALLAPPQSSETGNRAKIARLESWLARVSRREAGRV